MGGGGKGGGGAEEDENKDRSMRTSDEKQTVWETALS